MTRPPFLNDALAYAIANGYDRDNAHRALAELQALDDPREVVCRASVGLECLAPHCPCAVPDPEEDAT